jgi:hypothetical protein
MVRHLLWLFALSLVLLGVSDRYPNMPTSLSVWEVVLESPADTDDFCFARAHSPLILKRLDCVAQGGTTPSFPVTINECDSACASCVTTGGTVTADGGLDSDTTFSNAAIDSGDMIQFTIGTSSGSADWLTCAVTYQLPS